MPQRTVSSRSALIHGALQRILRRRELARGGQTARRAIATARVASSPLGGGGGSPAARSPARAFEFLVSPRSQLGTAQKRSPSAAAAALKARTPSPARSAGGAVAAAAAAAAAAAGGGSPPGEARAPLALMSDFSQALEDKNLSRAKALADRILVLEEDNQMMRDFVDTFATMEQRGDSLDASFPRPVDDADGDTDDEDDGSYYGAFDLSGDDGDVGGGVAGGGGGKDSDSEEEEDDDDEEEEDDEDSKDDDEDEEEDDLDDESD